MLFGKFYWTVQGWYQDQNNFGWKIFLPEEGNNDVKYKTANYKDIGNTICVDDNTVWSEKDGKQRCQKKD